MIIHYQIKRFDLVRTYFHNLLHSQRTRLIVLGSAAVFFLWILFLGYRSNNHLDSSDIVWALAYAIGYLVLFPLLMLLTAKTQQRTLEISSEGISTSIGKKQGKIPWSAVESISASGDRVFITGKNANAFTVPLGAFSSEEQRQAFVRLAMQYKHDATH